MNILITPYLDVALLTLYAFFLFFIGLVVYLRREDRREGYPLEDEMSGRRDTPGGVLLEAAPKTFRLPFDHGAVTVPRRDREPVDIAARRIDRFAGAPYAPTGDPLVDGIGPAAWAERARRPDVDWENRPRLLPLSADDEFWIARGDPDPRGWPVIASDGREVGVVSDLWIDRADRLIRYLEVSLGRVAGRGVLAPMFMATVERRRRRVVIDAINSDQFARVPSPQGDGVLTLYDEERIQAYFGGGYLYADARRQEPYL